MMTMKTMMVVHEGEGNSSKHFTRDSPSHWDLPLLGLGVILIIIIVIIVIIIVENNYFGYMIWLMTYIYGSE